MQIPIKACYGQAKPFGSIPRINWAHPLAQGLNIYVYDAGGGVLIDLVNGGLATRNGTTVPSYKLGSGFKYSSNADWTFLPQTPAASSIGSVLPWSCAMGTFCTGTPAQNVIAGVFNAADTGDNGPMFGGGINTNNICQLFDNGATQPNYNQTIATNTFQTWVAVATGATTATYYANGALDQNITGIASTTFTLPGPVGRVGINCGVTTSGTGGIIGFVPYFATWTRLLSASDARQLHDDPYCFLIYPEDEIFATLVGVTSVAAVNETNLNSIGSFKPTQLKAPVGLYRTYDVEPFFAVETNVHFLAKHVPTRLKVPLSLRQTHSYLPDVVSPEPHFVGKFTSTKLTRFNDLYFNPDVEPPVVETNVHFVGSFKPTKYYIDQAYRQIPDNQPPVIETNVHFVSTYKPTFSKYLSSLRQNADVEPFFAIETNTHFIAKFTPTSLKVLTPYRWFYPEDIDTPTNIQSETNINFIARFTSTKLYRNPALQQHYDFNPPVIETNVHFISTYKPVFSRFLNSLIQNSDIEPPVTETNIHTIGKFNSAKLNVLKLLLQNEAKDVFVVVAEPETNISFVAKFNPTKFYINSALRQHYDFNPPVVETNVSFVGKFYPTKFFLNQNLWQTDDIEPQVSETNVHFISSFKPTRINVLQGLRTNPAKDTEFSVIVTANPHFLAKFKPTRINLFEQFRSCPANDIPTFVAKFNFFTQIFG